MNINSQNRAIQIASQYASEILPQIVKVTIKKEEKREVRHVEFIEGWQNILKNIINTYPCRDHEILNYSVDLNILHGVEQKYFDVLTLNRYWLFLLDLNSKYNLPLVGHWQLDANYKLEALLKCLGLWDDSK